MASAFRAATRNDVPAIIALLAQDWIGTPNTLPMESYLADFDAMTGTQVFVATQGETVVATYQLTILRNLSLTAPVRAVLEGVRVRDDLRGQGIGAALVTDAEDRARAAGAALMQLTSNAARTDAHRFYRKLGYAQSHAGFKKLL